MEMPYQKTLDMASIASRSVGVRPDSPAIQVMRDVNSLRMLVYVELTRVIRGLTPQVRFCSCSPRRPVW
jgi:hypothetical protein